MPPKEGKNAKSQTERRTAHVKTKKRSSKAAARPALTAGDLLQKAQAALAFERYDAALECMQKALQLEPENVEILDAYGALLAELGQAEEAVEELQKAVALSPDEGFEKYMYLGQLLQGEQAIAAAQKGVELLRRDAEQSKQSGESAAVCQRLNKQLAAALCSLAEMKLGAAADVSEASTAADALLQQARAADPQSPEPLQILASLRYEQGHAEEALQLLKQSMALWFKPQAHSDEELEDLQESPAAEEADDDDELRVPTKPVTLSEEEMEAEEAGGSEEEDNEDEDDDDDGLPSYEFRFESAKMLLELDHTTETAIQVLEDLIAENDSVPHVWHLLGLSYYSGGMMTEASEVCKAGMELLKKQQQQQAGAAPDDEDILASFQDLESAIQEAAGPAEATTA